MENASKPSTGPELGAILKTYEHSQNWIHLADTKAGLVLTITGILTGFMLPQLVIWKKALVEGSASPCVLWATGILLF